MRIAFVGKGGSGKSTVSAEFCKACTRAGRKVLAIDLDYNMDLSYNLGIKDDISHRYISVSRPDFYKYTQLAANDPLKLIVDRMDDTPRFDPDNASDWYSQKYTVDVNGDIKAMVVGPLPDNRLYGKECGHVYMSPVRYFLPLLETQRCVVLDSTAGTDLVSFGMYQGTDAIICVVEPRSNSLRVFEQIKPIAKEFDIPLYVFVNKAEGENLDWLGEHASAVIGSLPFCNIYKDSSDSELINARFDELYKAVEKTTFDSAKRQGRIRNWKKIHDQLEAA
jgi:CO dehydrogenase maturation factor